MEVKLFLDCDGVLADFDAHFMEISGEHPRGYEDRHGSAAFWKVIMKTDKFFTSLKPMADAHRLYEAVKHLNPTILTGIPNGGWAEQQKLDWRDIYFPGVPMICCASKDKRKHMEPGKLNIIIDDWDKHKHLWEEYEGIFILHSDVDDSLDELRRLGVL